MKRLLRRSPLLLVLATLTGCEGLSDIDMTDPFGKEPANGQVYRGSGASRKPRAGGTEVAQTPPSDTGPVRPGSPTGWVDEDAPPPPAAPFPEPPPVPDYPAYPPTPAYPPYAGSPGAPAPLPGTAHALPTNGIDTSANPAGGTSDKDPYFKSLLGSAPQDLPTSGQWLTAPVGIDARSAPSLAALRGQVVYLHFAFSGCPSCGHMKPYLEQWQKIHGPNGFTVVFVCNGMMDTLDKAKEFASTHSFPLFYDKGAEATKQYAIRVFPMGYLIDRSGNVVWEGSPMGLEDKIGALVANTVK